MIFIQQGNQILYQKKYAAGSASAESTFDEYTLFSSGNFKNVLLAYAVVTLESQGKLNLQDTVSEFFSSSSEVFRKITVWQLLLHTSGLNDSVAFHSLKTINGKDINSLLKNVQKVSFEPGSQYLYSNLGLAVLRAIIEKTSGKRWDVYVSETIFQPAGMVHSKFSENPQPLSFDWSADTQWQTNLVDLRKFYNAINENIFLSPAKAAASYEALVPANWLSMQPPPHSLCWYVSGSYPQARLFYNCSEKLSFFVCPEKSVLMISIHEAPHNTVRTELFKKLLSEAVIKD